eukprot:9195683-Lingulodinium_polyedra.AAC.1
MPGGRGGRRTGPASGLVELRRHIRYVIGSILVGPPGCVRSQVVPLRVRRRAAPLALALRR